MAREEIRMKWESRITAFRASGEKATNWCKANQVNRRQLYAWMKKLDASSSAPTAVTRALFIPVQVAPETKQELSACLRIRIGAAVIEVDTGFHPALLREVVRALEDDHLC
jgi:hypothetical protein